MLAAVVVLMLVEFHTVATKTVDCSSPPSDALRALLNDRRGAAVAIIGLVVACEIAHAVTLPAGIISIVV